MFEATSVGNGALEKGSEVSTGPDETAAAGVRVGAGVAVGLKRRNAPVVILAGSVDANAAGRGVVESGDMGVAGADAVGDKRGSGGNLVKDEAVNAKRAEGLGAPSGVANSASGPNDTRDCTVDLTTTGRCRVIIALLLDAPATESSSPSGESCDFLAVDRKSNLPAPPPPAVAPRGPVEPSDKAVAAASGPVEAEPSAVRVTPVVAPRTASVGWKGVDISEVGLFRSGEPDDGAGATVSVAGRSLLHQCKGTKSNKNN